MNAMNAKIESSERSRTLDNAQLVLAVLFIVAGIVGYYWFGQWPGLARAGLLVGAIVIAIAIGAFTRFGRGVREYLVESQFELRKVVWPTRDETVRTTLVIIAITIVLSLLLGLIDLILKWVVFDTLLKLSH